MALVHVYQRPDSTLSVVYPDQLERLPGESDQDYATRRFEQVEVRDPSLAGLPFAEVDEAALPARDARAAWRLAGGAVVVDQTLLDAQTSATTIRQQIIAAAQSAVGVVLVDLTPAQRNALVVGLLHRAGGVTHDGKIRPLADWMR